MNFLKVKSLNIFCTALFAFTGLNAFSQTPTPGGVPSTNLTLWLKADNAASITGSPVQNWTNSGVNNPTYKVSQSTASKRPPLLNGSSNSNKYNFNPSIKFTTASGTVLTNNAILPDFLGTNGTAIVVTNQDISGGSAFTFTTGLSNSGRYQLKPTGRFQSGFTGSSAGYTYDWGTPTDYSVNSAVMIASYGCGSTATMRKNSIPSVTYSHPISPEPLSKYYPSISNGLYLGANNAGEYSSASIAEVILFNTKPTAAEMGRIESYLAIKYGITRGGNANPTSTYDYYASDGTTLWDKTINTGYNNDIAVIGRDDLSGLAQKQSISVNNGEAVTIALGSGAIPTENATNTDTFLSDKSFLAWGNNGLTTAFDNTNNKPTGIKERLNRIWKLQLTNFSQVTTFGFETGQITNIGPTGSLSLLFDDDGDFSNATIVSSCIGTNPTGNRIEFTGINIPAGKPFFTLARVIAPQQLANNGPLCTGSTLNLTSEEIGTTATYSWTGPNGFTSADQNPTIAIAETTAAGIYTAAITAYGCTTTLTTTVTINPNPTVTVNNLSMCEATPTNLTAIPGTTGNYTYAWIVPSGSTNPGNVASFTPDKQGKYTVVIKDTEADCISKPASGTVTINPNPTATVNNPSGCQGGTTTMTVIPGTAGTYTYSWTVPSGANDPGNVNSFNPTTSGTYSVVITDPSTSCNSVITSGTATINPLPTVAVNNPTACEDTLQSITATPGTTGIYTYTWTVPSGVSNPGDVNSFNPTTSGSYSVVITDLSTLCSSISTTGIVTINPLPKPVLDPVMICIDEKTGTVIHNATLDTKLNNTAYQYTWFLAPNTVAIAGAQSSTYTTTKAGDYTVEVLNTDTGCSSSSTVTVTESNPAESATPIESFNNQGKRTVTVNVVGNGTYLYSMDGGNFQNSNVFDNVSSGAHTITIHDTAGCTDITITVKALSATIPKGISPGSDEKNNNFDLTNLNVNRLEIFNRYGTEVYNQNNYTNQWSGQTNDGTELPDGTYFYQIHTDNEITTGWVYVMREQ